MTAKRWTEHRQLAGLLLTVLIMGPGKVLAECSADHVGLASINEISDKDGFIEVKILSADIKESVWSGWTLDFCSTNGRGGNPSLDCTFDLSLSDADASGEPWLVLDSADIDLAGMDIRLKDAQGQTIDYVQVADGAGTGQIADPACGAQELPYDSYVSPVGGQSGQFARRLPDGTGDWSMASGASGGKSTESDTNDDEAAGPPIGVTGGGAFAGDPISFSISLPEGETASRDITIQYRTEDRTALSPGDYAASTGSVVLPAGSSSVTVPVTTVADSDPQTERFWLRITDISFGVTGSEIGVGEIWPSATGLWRFEQSTEDSSGNGLDGSINSAFDYSDDDPAPGSCFHGVLNNGGILEFGRFLVGDDERLDLSEALTLAAWVRRDESGSGYVLSKGDNYQWFVDGDGRLYWRWGNRSLVSDPGVLPRGVWAHIAVTYRDGEQVLYVNGEVRENATYSGSLPTNTEDLILGREYFWDLRGRQTRFDGAVDELHLYSDALPVSAVRQIFQRTYPCGGGAVLDRLELTVPASASVCAPAGVYLTAYDSNGDILDTYEGTVSLSSSTSHGRWSLDTAAGTLFPDPDTSDDGSASYRFDAADGGDATFAFANTHADVLTITAVDQETGIGTISDAVTFAENALFIESVDALGDDLIAGRPHHYQVSMLRQDPDSGECGVASDYDGTFGLKAWLERTADDPGGLAPQVASAEDSVTPPDSVPADNNVNIGFDGGVGSIVLTPGDVGRYTLNLTDDSSGFVRDIDGNPLPVVSASAAAPWTARPFALGLEVTGNPGAQDAAGPVFLAAGEDFSLRVGGALYDGADDANGDGVAEEGANLMDNGFAPSFGQEGEQVALTAGLLAPTTGDNPGLAGPQPQAGDFGGGLAAVDGYRFTEVGIIDLTAVIGDGNYLAAGSDRTTRMEGSSGPVGRFVPHHFTVDGQEDGVIDAVCGGADGFTYSGQDAGWALVPEVSVVPRNLDGGRTRNYLIGDFMRLLPEGVARAWPSADEVAMLADDATPYPVTVENETGEIAPRGDGEPIVYRYASGDVIRYSKSAGAVVAPFAPTLTFTVEDIVDQDGVAALTSGTGRVPLDLEPDANGDIYYGRRVLENVYGPETADELRMPFYMEYWTGSGFAVNESDSCTDWSANANLQDPEQYHSLASRGESGTFDAGVAEPLVLEPTGDTGEDVLGWSGLPVWQQHDWDGDGSPEGPSATATFGVYRGHDRIIYWREVND